ncbi:alkene reductase [Dietzia sp. PP-33]|uniref:alkene reductase n=1 Tax=Dietzia sp. PP-33 TaxID=2957500 RepID=UPI0029BFCCA6|nr:alkene reductase [Dietzia sp. PP-33]
MNGNVETVSGDPTTTSRLFEPWRLGRIELANRVVMAPMTRNRADDDGVLPESAVTYYEQRAGAGLIVSEATQPSSAGQGYPGTPGIHDDRQESQWAKVADAVHAKGGKIFCQLMHTGRMSHESFMPPGGKVVAPSPIRADIEVETIDRVMVPAPVPTELDQDGIDAIIRDFADASERAVRAGMDGVEIHGANGYLPHQFLSPGTNQRTDGYGGSPEARARFVVELLRAVCDRIGGDRVGLRISPGGQFNDMSDKGNDETYVALIDQIDELGLAYLHTLRRRSTPLHETLRERWSTTYMLNTGFHGTSERADLEPLLDSGQADLVSVGRLFISNPDLLDRWRHGIERDTWDESTFYTGGDRGYIDYPATQH